MTISIYLLLISLVIFLTCELGKTRDCSKALKIPVVRFSYFLPNFLNRLLFFIYGPSLIYHGYERYKDVPYRVLKADGDLIVLPRRYAEELRQLPPSRLSSLDAQFENVLGDYTGVLVESRLPSWTVSKKLIPMLNKLIPTILDEMSRAFDIEVPECVDHFVPIKPYNTILRLLTRATARIIAGKDLSRNENLLSHSTTYTLNLGLTLILLRPFPDFLRPFIARLLPSAYKLRKQMESAKQDLFVPIINQRILNASNPGCEKPDDFLQWMLDLADNDRDLEPDFLAHNLFIIMSLAVAETSTMALTQALFDLVVYPECVGPLREEIRSTFKNGWRGITVQELAALRLMDSFMRESQRLNPASEVSFHRKVKSTPITLSDGFVLPVGVHVCFPSGPMSRDSSIVPNADTFDAFRWCYGSDSSTSSPKSFVTISETHMHFGFGRQACPGRVFAATAMKIVLSRFLLDYEVVFEDHGETKKQRPTRPSNIVNGEQILPSFRATVLIRKRRG